MTTHEEPTWPAQQTPDHGTTAGSFASELPILFEAPDVTGIRDIKAWALRVLDHDHVSFCITCDRLDAVCRFCWCCPVCIDGSERLGQAHELYCRGD